MNNRDNNKETVLRNFRILGATYPIVQSYEQSVTYSLEGDPKLTLRRMAKVQGLIDKTELELFPLLDSNINFSQDERITLLDCYQRIESFRNYSISPQGNGNAWGGPKLQTRLITISKLLGFLDMVIDKM